MAIEIDYSGQAVLVTGGATGLGQAVAEAFGRAGAKVALNDSVSGTFLGFVDGESVWRRRVAT